uniref:RNase H type-1 domain-containing protein n=1 Tax=Nelumbo nucifera TaxID=4432 RepID=A0A822Z876_NELNU|nr:TPA_asm: hypothetical protein HUJ06_013902 [Nelumbo nucifera]
MWIKWLPPVVFIVKINVDGASRGNPGESIRGGIFRDHEGSFLFGFSCYFGIASNMKAKLLVIQQVVSYAKDHNLRSLWIESDSKMAVEILNKSCSYPWKVLGIVDEITKAFEDFDITITHTHREGNIVADSLANFGCDERKDEVLFCTVCYYKLRSCMV